MRMRPGDFTTTYSGTLSPLLPTTDNDPSPKKRKEKRVQTTSTECKLASSEEQIRSDIPSLNTQYCNKKLVVYQTTSLAYCILLSYFPFR
ncbi:hypothetical protein BDZ91DRAFT_327352 [Kalaharituber pfeilii]|nr:hypothetical protein BDZ91DRAFT_327352 [Kalaharituber pfeilii]